MIKSPAFFCFFSVDFADYKKDFVVPV